jgi:hypothetical protein
MKASVNVSSKIIPPFAELRIKGRLSSWLIKWILTFIISLMMFSVIVGCCRPPLLTKLPVNLKSQQRDWWCWAATTEMISDYYEHRIEQCDSVNFIHGTPPDCCTGCLGNCPCWGPLWGASIDDIKNNWVHWNFKFTYIASSLSWDTIKATLSDKPSCKKSPIQVIWWYTAGGGHVITVYGYQEVEKMKYIYYLDPLPPGCEKNLEQCSTVSGGEDAVVSYDAFISNSLYIWGDSFYNFVYSGS